LEIIDDNLNHVASNFQIKNVISTAKTKENIWAVNQAGMFKLDSILNLQRLYSPEPNEIMKNARSYGDTVFVSSEYQTLDHIDLVIRKYIPQDSFAVIPMDIKIDDLFFPDKVYREIWNGLPYAFQLRFDSLGVLIHNQSEDTLFSCVVNCDWDADVYCIGFQREWIFDSINIPPQGNASLQLGAFITDVLYYGAGPPFCFWVDVPNGQPDAFPDNDKLCGSPEIVNSLNDPIDTGQIAFYPNPAEDKITISSRSSEPLKVFSLYNSQGILLKTFRESTSKVTLSIQDLIPGLYYIVFKYNDLNSGNYYRFIKV
jgi:hypothetical protein